MHHKHLIPYRYPWISQTAPYMKYYLPMYLQNQIDLLPLEDQKRSLWQAIPIFVQILPVSGDS